MKYMGSKSRIAKYIVPIIQNCIDTNSITHYYELFVGGANVIDKIKCKHKTGNDLNRYLIALFTYLQEDKPLLDSVSKELYSEVRANYKNNIYDDWYVGNIGFLSSFNGRWFDGGYATPGTERTKNGERYRDYYQEAKANISKQMQDLRGVIFTCGDYKSVEIIPNSVIYCDPPYKDTKQYSNAVDFNHDEFWEYMRQLSKNNYVFISEESAPNDFIPIWQKSVARTIKATDKSTSIEKLFIYSNGLQTRPMIKQHKLF